MFSKNEVELIGRAGNNPEIKETETSRFAKLRFATTETYQKSGQNIEETEWHSLVFWGDGIVRIVEKHVRKGDYLLMRGKIKTRKWTDQAGEQRYSTEIHVHKIGFLQPKQDGPEGAED